MTNRPVRRIKCRFCDYTVPIFSRTRTGHARSWFTRLSDHIDYAHPSESKLEKLIAEEERRLNAQSQ